LNVGISALMKPGGLAAGQVLNGIIANEAI
jgi:hypothetical protein